MLYAITMGQIINEYNMLSGKYRYKASLNTIVTAMPLLLLLYWELLLSLYLQYSIHQQTVIHRNSSITGLTNLINAEAQQPNGYTNMKNEYNAKVTQTEIKRQWRPSYDRKKTQVLGGSIG